MHIHIYIYIYIYIYNYAFYYINFVFQRHNMHLECMTDLFSAVGSVSVFHFLSLQTPHTIPCTSNTATTPIAIPPNSTPTVVAVLLFADLGLFNKSM